MKRVIQIAVVLAVAASAAGGTAWSLKKKAVTATSYTTEPLKRGLLVATIAATGTIDPEEVVDVGVQVAGLINAFGTDENGKTTDYGSEVESGTVLAKIDGSVYATDARQNGAQLQQAQAGVAGAESNLDQLKAKFEQSRRDPERAQNIGPSDALAQSAYDAYRSSCDGGKAHVTAGEAAVLQARAAVVQSEAVVSWAQLNQRYCVIKSPVKGVIIDRRVNIGQTVVASLNALSLFLMAKDLRRMEVWVPVNEADIGSIQRGQPVTFTVDAHPGETFEGVVGQVRLNATTSQNVVTFTVEVNTDNSSGRLLPYLTANAQFRVDRRENVLMVPNAALWWVPQPEWVAPDARTAPSRGQRGAGVGAQEDAPRGIPTIGTCLPDDGCKARDCPGTWWC